jgi:hypothetical protein
MGNPRLIQIHCFEMLIAPVHELIFSKGNKMSSRSSIDGSLVIIGHGLRGFGHSVKKSESSQSCIVNWCGSITLVLSKVMFDCEGHWLLPNIEVATWYNDRLAIPEESYCCQRHCGAPKS